MIEWDIDLQKFKWDSVKQFVYLIEGENLPHFLLIEKADVINELDYFDAQSRIEKVGVVKQVTFLLSDGRTLLFSAMQSMRDPHAPLNVYLTLGELNMQVILHQKFVEGVNKILAGSSSHVAEGYSFVNWATFEYR